MTTKAKKLFLFIGIVIGVLTACLGLETKYSNHLGWALLLAGTAFTTVGCLYLGALFFRDGGKQPVRDRSLWPPILGVLVISLVTPLEYLYLPGVLPRSDFAQDAGLILFSGGLITYLLSLQPAEPEKPRTNQSLPKEVTVLTAFSHLSRSTLLAGLLLMMFGLGIGYSSLLGLSILFLLVLVDLPRWVKMDHHRLSQ